MSKAGKQLISAVKELRDALRDDNWVVSYTERGNMVLTPGPVTAASLEDERIENRLINFPAR